MGITIAMITQSLEVTKLAMLSRYVGESAFTNLFFVGVCYKNGY